MEKIGMFSSSGKYWLLLIAAAIGLTSAAWSGRRRSTSDLPQRPAQSFASAEARVLGSLPYASAGRDHSGLHGVTQHDRQKAFQGVNLYAGRFKHGADLLDMEGRVVHSFVDKEPGRRRGWELVKRCGENEFLVLLDETALLRIDWDSNILWERSGRFHHDMSVAPNGDIFAVRNQHVDFPPISTSERIQDNLLMVLSADGTVRREISLARAVMGVPALREVVRDETRKEYSIDSQSWDVMHTNTIDAIASDVEVDGRRLFSKGMVLFCMRNLDLVGVIDVEQEAIIWHWGPGELDQPHQPTLLENGRILIFDNGPGRGYSRVIEVNPATGRIERQIGDGDSLRFFTATRGSAQRLANGNTIIVESEKGRAFEVAPDGTVVWEFYSFADEGTPGSRELFYRLPRWPWPEQLKAVNDVQL